MATKTWIGAAGGAWATSTNWSPSGVPATADDIIFDGRDSSPTISTTARTCASLTINGGTCSIGGSAAFTITGALYNAGSFTLPTSFTLQGNLTNDGYIETTTTGSVTATGGNNQTWSIGSHNFHTTTINKTAGSTLTLNGSLSVLRTTSSVFTYTAGNLNQNGNTISCRTLTASASGARTWTMDAVVDITPQGSTGTITALNLNAAVTFAAKNTFTVSPQSSTGALTITGPGTASVANAATAVRANHPSIALYTNLDNGTKRNWNLSGFWEDIYIDGNFSSGVFAFWNSVTGSNSTLVQGTSSTEVHAIALLTNNTTTYIHYPARIYRISSAAGGVAAGTVLTNASFNNYSWDWWDGGPIGRAFIYDLGCAYATHELVIDGGALTGWTSYTLTANGTGSTYWLHYLRDTATGNAINLSGVNANYYLVDVDTIGTITHTQGTINLSTSWPAVYTRAWSTSGGNRHINFGGQSIIINGSHRSGVNGTGTFSTSTQTAGTTLTTDSPTQGGGFIFQTTGSISFGTTWNINSLPHVTIESLADVLLTTIQTFYARTFTVNNAVALGTSTSACNIYITHGIGWNGNSPVAHTLFRYANLIYYGLNEDTTIDCRPYNDYNNINYRFASVYTATVAGTSVVNWNVYTSGTFTWSRPGGTCTLDDVVCLSSCNLGAATGTTIYNINGAITTSLNLTASGTANSTYNVNNFTNTPISPFNSQISCGAAGTGTNVYNLNGVNLTGNNISNRILFNGIGTLNIGSSVYTGFFNISEATIARTLNFGQNWVYLKSGAVISCNLTTTTVTTTTQKTMFSGAGGFRIYEGNTGTLTTSGITESNALNLYFEQGYTATLSGLAWRNIYADNAGYFTNSNLVLTLYGDFFAYTGDSTAPLWPTTTINFSATDTNVPQYIDIYPASGYNPIPLGTANFNSAAPKVIGARNTDTSIKTVNHSAGNLVIIRDSYLRCDRFTPSGGTICAYGDIYTNWWDDADNSGLNWQGSGYVEVGNSLTTSVTGWAAINMFNSGTAYGATEGPNLRINEVSWPIRIENNSLVKNLNLSNGNSLKGTNLNVYKGLIYNGGNITSGIGPSAVAPDPDPMYTNGGFTPALHTRTVNGTSMQIVTTGSFCSVAWKLPVSLAKPIKITFSTAATATGQSIGIFSQPIPGTLAGPGNVHGLSSSSPFYSSWTYTTSFAQIPSGANNYIIIDVNNRSFEINGTGYGFPTQSGNGPGFWFILSDSSSTSTFNVTLEWNPTVDSTLYPGYYILGENNPPVINFPAVNGARYLLSSASSMSTAFYGFNRTTSATVEVDPKSASLKLTDLTLDNSSSKLKTNSVNIETPKISGNLGELQPDSSQITITGSGTTLSANKILTSTTTNAKYSTYFSGTNYGVVVQSTTDPTKIINLNSTSYWQVELWYWPTQRYDSNWSATSPVPVGLLRKADVPTSAGSDVDWEIAIDPITQYLEFINGTTTYATTLSPVPNTWNYLRVNYVAANYGNAGGGAGQDGMSLFDGKFSYRGRSGYTVGQNWIAAPAALPSTTNWSVLFDGTDDGLVIADNAKYYFGSSNFTIELWVYNTAFDATGNMLFEKGIFASGKEFRAYITSTTVIFEGNLTASATGAYTTITATTTNSLNTWYHFAFVRSGNTLYILRNGSLLTSAAFTGTIFNTTQLMCIGGAADGNNALITNGYISNFRIINGQALATGAYTVPTQPLTTTTTGWQISGSTVPLTGTVALLTCNTDSFIDTSENPLSLSFRSGVPQITSFSPFGSSYYNSVFFNGTYLETPNSTDINLGAAYEISGGEEVSTVQIEYLVVGGGGGGGTTTGGIGNGMAGGGGGGFLTGNTTLNLGPLYTVSVGEGGAAGVSGSNSQLSTIIAYGGGRGAGDLSGLAQNGGSGGGAITSNVSAIGLGTTGQGFSGGQGWPGGGNSGGGGGGGASAAGQQGGTGGDGKYSSITGTQVGYSGGGGGGNTNELGGAGATLYGAGNGCGTGNGGCTGTAAINGTGGGGGNGASGGRGVIVLKYQKVYILTITGSVTHSTVTTGDYKVTTISQGSGQLYFSSPTPLTTGWTVESWINMPYIKGTGASYLMGMSNGAGAVNKWSLSVNTSTGFGYQANRVGFQTYISGVNTWINSSYTWQTDKWYHIAATHIPSNGALNYSYSFDGTGDYLLAQNNPTLELNNSDFCIETFYRTTNFVGTKTLIAKRSNPSTDYGFLISTYNNNVLVYISSSNTSWNIVNGITIGKLVSTEWAHIAIYRINNSWYSSFNGNITILNANNSASVLLNSADWSIGGESTGTETITGNLAYTRFVIGSSVYTSTVATPPTMPLTNITNTKLLLTGSNSIFLDASANNYQLTTVGNVSESTLSPFTSLPTTGSASFDGSGDYAQITSITATDWFTATGDWTFEAWIYPKSFNGPQYSCPIFAFTSDDLLFRANPTSASTTSLNIYGIDSAGSPAFGGSGTSAGSISINQWSWVVVTRESGVLNIWINGTRVLNTSTYAATLLRTTASDIELGSANAGSNPFWNGNISNAKWVSGSAIYSGSTITVPTQPATVTAGTRLLTFQTHSIYDSSSNNATIIPYGNVGSTSGLTPFDAITKLYVNGELVGSMTGNSASSSTGVLRIAADGEATGFFRGYISNVRIHRGSSLYKYSFTPTTQPLTAITGTVLLTCQGNGYFDNNTQLTQKTITRSSDSIRTDNFSPFYSGSAKGANASSDGDYSTTGFHGPLQGGSPFVGSYGGAGGGGYWGGSAGGYSESNTMGGGGGGSSYIHSTLASGIIYDANYTTPGNSNDSDRGTSGNGGLVNSRGTDGEVIITYGATTLNYTTAGIYTWTCPAGVTTISTKCWGAGGAGGNTGGWGVGFVGGAGAGVVANITVTPGTIYYITVGSGGGSISAGAGGSIVNSTVPGFGGGGVSSRSNADNRYGAGGGGYSGIFTTNPATQSSALVVAGGGGGGGSSRRTYELQFLTGTNSGSTGTRTIVTASMGALTHRADLDYYIGNYFQGYIKDLKISQNTFDINNTIPSETLTSNTNTLLLTCQNNTFIDNSSTPKTLTMSGAVTRHIAGGTPVNNESEIIFAGTGTNTAIFSGSLDRLTNNIQYTPTNPSVNPYQGTGYLELIGCDTTGSRPTVNTLQLGAGNYSKAFKTGYNPQQLYDEQLLAPIVRWNNKTTYYMSQWADLGSGYAHGPIIATTYSLIHNNLPTHTHVRYQLKWHFVDSVDNETNTLAIDGTTYLQFTKLYTVAGANSITTNLLNIFSWTTGTYSYSPFSTSSIDGYFTIDTGWIPHTSSTITIAHYSGVNEAQANEATYLTHAKLDLQNNGIDVSIQSEDSSTLGITNLNIDGTATNTNYLIGSLKQLNSAATVNVNYLGINSSVVSGGANQYWFATNSIDYGGNTGWSFGGGQITTQDKSFFFFIIT